MLKVVLAVVVGYVVMAILVFATFTAAYFLMGADRSFQPGSYETSGLWVVASLVLGFIAALVGGLVSAAVAKNPKGPVALAVVVLVLGVVLALTATDGERPTVREGDVGNFEAMQYAKQPQWLTFVNPLLGAVGVLIGGRMRRTGEAPAAGA